MIKKNQELLNRLNLLSDGLLIVCSLYAARYLRFSYFPNGVQSIPLSYYRYTALGMSVVQMLIYYIVGTYQPQRKRRLRKLCFNIVIVNLFCIIALQAFLYIFRIEDFSRIMLAVFFFVESACVCGKHITTRLLLRRMRRMGFNQKHIIIVGSGKIAKRCLDELNKSPELGSTVLGYLSESERISELKYFGPPEHLGTVLESVRPDEVIAALEMDEQLDINTLVYACDQAGVRLSLIPPYAGHRTTGPQLDMINDIPLLVMRRVPLDYRANAAIKRSADIIGAMVMLVLLGPLMLGIAIGVKLSSPGPVLFRQERVGFKNTPFFMLKFRSMRMNDVENTAWTGKKDPRRTRFGAIIRQWSLDELPQLINVLRGEMSLVGPRPELPIFVEKYRQSVPMYMIKHMVRPGMTGLAQVNGFRGDTSIQRRIELDVYYVENWTVWLDLKILLQTLGRLKNDEEN